LQKVKERRKSTTLLLFVLFGMRKEPSSNTDIDEKDEWCGEGVGR
jgi:hypothetical protein